MANLAGEADWLNASGNDEELREAARYAVQSGYVRVSDEIKRRLAPLPDISPDIAARFVRDAVNARKLTLEMRIEDGEPGYDLEGADAWTSLARALLDRHPKKHYATCEHCGSAFSTMRPLTKYCSERCRSAAYQKRKLKSASHVAKMPILDK